MQMTAVYFCVRILSEAAAGLPPHLYKYTDSGGKAMAPDHQLCRCYSAGLSENVVRGMTDNALRCKFNGGTTPIGRRRPPVEKSHKKITLQLGIAEMRASCQNKHRKARNKAEHWRKRHEGI